MAKPVSLAVLACQLTLCCLLLLPATTFGIEGGEGLALKYRRAHEKADVDALRSLVYWEGVSDRSREIIEDRLKKYLKYPVKDIELRPLSGDERFGVSGYRPNLEPVGWLAISFEAPPGESPFSGTVFVVGKHKGKHFISVAVPVK